jgi:hypothetical protein
LLEEAILQMISSEATASELLARFNGVSLQDGTVISLPASLAEQWQGSGKAGQEAALRVQGRVEWSSGQLQGWWLQEARAAERSGPAIQTPLPAGSLFLADMGCFTLQEMRARGKLEQYWLTHAKATLTIIDERGQCWDLLSFLGAQAGDQVDTHVCVGKRERLPVRLIAVRVWAQEAQRRRDQANKQIPHPPKGCQAQVPGQPKSKQQRQGKPKRKKVSAARLRLADWTIRLPNVPQDMLSVQEALVLMRCRWHMEIVQPQMTKAGVLTAWGGGDHVADLHLVVRNNHAINQ